MLNRLLHSPVPLCLTATCHGLANNNESPTLDQTGLFAYDVQIGQFKELSAAAEASVQYVAEERYGQAFNTETAAAIALHIDICDDAGERILRGIVLGNIVDWCPPARNKKEERLIRKLLDRLSGEYVYQDHEVERKTALLLGFDHVDRIEERITFLEGCLVPPAWRGHAIRVYAQQTRQLIATLDLGGYNQ